MMKTPINRIQFEHNVNVIYEQALAKKLQITTLQRLIKVRHLPNGRMDLETIHPQLRLEGNMLDTIRVILPK
jgi:hypothetical protein